MKNLKLEDIVELDRWFQESANTSYKLGKIVEVGFGYVVLMGLHDDSPSKAKISTLDLRGNIITLESQNFY